MMTTVYTQIVTTTVTLRFTRVTNTERLRQWICQHRPGTLIEQTVRQLAALVGIPEGAVSPGLKRLAHDGYIDLLSWARGTLIEVLDRSADAAASDQGIDQDLGNLDRSLAENPIDQAIAPLDRPDVYGTDHDSHDNNNNAHMRELEPSAITLQPTPLNPPPDNPIIADVWPAIQRATPGYTIADFDQDFAVMLERGKDEYNAANIIAWARSNGKPIYSATDLSTRARAYRAAQQIAVDEPQQEQGATDENVTVHRATAAASTAVYPGSSVAAQPRRRGTSGRDAHTHGRGRSGADHRPNNHIPTDFGIDPELLALLDTENAAGAGAVAAL